MKKFLLGTSALAALLGSVLQAQNLSDASPQRKLMAPDATPAFEVATIKPSKPEERVSVLMNRSGILTTTGTSLSGLIKFAYDLHARQIKGPSWIDTERYDVTGKPDPAGIPNREQVKAMVQKLLADRFQLAFHREKKELPVYLITTAKTGIKLVRNESNPDGPFGVGRVLPGDINVKKTTMAGFVRMLQGNILEEPVLDRTGLGAATYDFILRWTPDASPSPFDSPAANPPAPAVDPDAPPDLFTAFQQQLGLKLESAKAPVDVLVIDRVERPSAN